MSALAVALVVVTLAAGGAAAWVETTGRTGYGALKMTAASGYLAFALNLGALESVYGQAILGGLLLSWAGDFFLIGESRTSFTVGLGAFLLAHLAYAVAFAINGVAPPPVALGAVVMALVGGVTLRWLLRAGLPGPMRAPVAAYLLAIGSMVALALGTRLFPVMAGAIAFAASDVFVARQRFVTPSAVNRRVGLPLYFVGQLLITLSV